MVVLSLGRFFCLVFGFVLGAILILPSIGLSLIRGSGVMRGKRRPPVFVIVSH